MSAVPVVVIFDVGKTNKKIFLFDENYKIVFERSARFIETFDEDGDPCENLESLRLSVYDSLREVLRRKEFEIRAINFSTYGASFVYIDEYGKPLAPLYNYLKAYPEDIKKEFYKKYGGENAISAATASPVLDSLNSGMQLYRLKKEQPAVYKKLKYALHLPQYLSYLVSGAEYSDLTSIGCHTQLWDFTKNDYHDWVKKEGLDKKLAPIVDGDEVFPSEFPGNQYKVGVGLHDSSAALIPYLINFHEPFVLISTGTWCITLNPFNSSPLKPEELEQDCLSYMQYKGKPVKASRIFAGYEHEQQLKRISSHFNQGPGRYRNMKYDAGIIYDLLREMESRNEPVVPVWSKDSAFISRDLNSFSSDKIAYHQFILDIARQQLASTKLVIGDSKVKRIFVDGGFSKNAIYMNLLAMMFPEMEVFAASMAQATAIGTALAIHKCWNTKPMPNDIIELKYYASNNDLAL
ncbi:Sugar (pentulose or hexulose) kinase [Pedobacter westerhofensis]|uniref:Sugar (Pentulose or hexulose) kinase n=1 Tax=Pedobacter westerhofensis TaxID=425512 RepID=A0A521DYM6_9SPHI|nr:FGGY family carbohydrate kinase [Pedobacter westerhofensis]SMO76834.1 Sugar (pentulose or hexulose) kinase [Pedobacter westerhofensis]